MKVLITGSSGYVGYVLAKHFSEKGIKVVGLSHHENPVWRGNKNFKFYECDVTDWNRLKNIFQKEQPTHVIHLAYSMNPMHDVNRENEIDIDGSMNAIQAANETKSVKQFIKMSSASIYGAWPNNELWIKENHELRPRDWRYARNKKIIEHYYNSFEKRKDMKIVIFRLCTAIGPLYHKKGGVVSIMINSPFMLKINNRYCELQFIHEDDLTNVFDLVTNDKKVEGTFNLAPDSYSTTKELVPNKFFIPVPLWLMRGIIRILWTLHLSAINPAGITLSTYGIVVDPHKLMNHYHYKFKYSTAEAFKDTVEKRKELGTL